MFDICDTFFLRAEQYIVFCNLVNKYFFWTQKVSRFKSVRMVSAYNMATITQTVFSIDIDTNFDKIK